MIDIERQLLGDAIDEGVKEKLATKEGMLPQQIHLLEKLTMWPTSSCVEDEWCRRSEVINAVTAYCSVEEGGLRRGRKPKRLEQDVSPPASHPGNEEAQSASLLNATLEDLCQAPRPVTCFLGRGDHKSGITDDAPQGAPWPLGDVSTGGSGDSQDRRGPSRPAHKDPLRPEAQEGRKGASTTTNRC
jgi:Protein of unknown function (DUF3435)